MILSNWMKRPTSNEREIENAFNTLPQAPADALLVGPGPFLDSRRHQLVTLAAKIGIPAGYETRTTALAGGLTSYGPSVADGYRQAGIYVGKNSPGHQTSSTCLHRTAYQIRAGHQFETAKALGITVPDQLLVRADEVIE